MCLICRLYFGTIKMMSNHRQSCRGIDDSVENNDASDVEKVTERVRPLRIAAIRQQKALCVLRMQQIEWISLDDIECGNKEDVPAVKNPVVANPLFDATRRMLLTQEIMKTIMNDI